ncbi:MAG TPA: hypothetical protein ENI23_00500 [bacterium]|nr:hypothetical protein [bacterium]
MRKPFTQKAKEFVQNIGTIIFVLAIITVGGMILVGWSTIMVKVYETVYKLDLSEIVKFIFGR